MLLFFIYAALGVELFGRLGECGPATSLLSGTNPQTDASPGIPAPTATPYQSSHNRLMGCGHDRELAPTQTMGLPECPHPALPPSAFTL
jgi:hypothetical protein